VKLSELDEEADRQLRSIDQRFVAAAAPKVARAVESSGAAWRRTKDAAAGIVQDVDLRDLNALDAKYATRGPLALLREIPQLMAVVIGIVFIVGTLAAAHELKDRQQAGTDQTVLAPDGSNGSGEAPAVVALGPTVGKTAAAYLSLATHSLDAAAAGAPDEQRLALVTLSAYYRPSQAASILSGYQVKRAWVRDSTAGKLAPPMPVEVADGLAPALSQFYARTAKGQSEAATQYQNLADTTSNDPQYKAFYEQFATLSRKQARAFGGNCACVYAFVVQATPTQLLSLRARPGVRAIEVAGRGSTLPNLDITTLLPEVKGVVSNPAAVVDPPS
jgi:hypothetical protein